ncbi:MAG: hypothetical protein ACRCZI_08335, partial [Cetobacterium sp.]
MTVEGGPLANDIGTEDLAEEATGGITICDVEASRVHSSEEGCQCPAKAFLVAEVIKHREALDMKVSSGDTVVNLGGRLGPKIL